MEPPKMAAMSGLILSLNSSKLIVLPSPLVERAETSISARRASNKRVRSTALLYEFFPPGQLVPDLNSPNMPMTRSSLHNDCTNSA